MRLHYQLLEVQNGEAVDDVGAEVWIDVFGEVPSDSFAVPGPVGEVANNLEVP
jgi:hypothetical protein